jgi:hypothetical protein
MKFSIMAAVLSSTFITTYKDRTRFDPDCDFPLSSKEQLV